MLNIPTHENIPGPPHEAARQLQLALTRYERLCSTPRWMTVPYCSDISSYERARDHAIDTGNESRAAEIQGWLDQEWRRRELLAQWQGEPIWPLMLTEQERGETWKGRTVYAWSELLSRMVQARQNAVGADALDRESQSYIAIGDRIRDVEHRIAVAKRREAMGEPAVA